MSVIDILRQLLDPQITGPGIGPPDGTFDTPHCEAWVTLDSDMAARMYRNDVQLTVNFGIGSAVRGIKSSIYKFDRELSGAITRRRRASRLAAQSILAPIQQEIFNLMALSIQGHFEKAYRRWLRNSLLMLNDNPITDEDVVKAQWSNPANPRRDLGELMAHIRGVHLRDTVEGPYLLELALVGNVVRHGDGPSARIVYEQYPHLFDPVTVFDGAPAHEEDEEIPERLRISEERICTYAQAAYQFWHRIQYAYTSEY